MLRDLCPRTLIDWVLIILGAVVLALPTAHPVFRSLSSCTDQVSCFKSYVPIRHRYLTANDDYFYYSRVREVLNGNFFSGDSVTLENRDRYTPHISYALSFIAGSFGGWWDGRTQSAYIFNNTVLVWVLGLFLILLVRIFVSDVCLALLVSALGLLPLGVLRFPNIQFTAIPLTILLILVVRTAKQREIRPFEMAIASAILGSAILTSIPNFFICFGLWTGLCAYSIHSKKLLRACLIVLALGSVFSVPGGVLFLQGKAFEVEWTRLAIPPIDQYSGFSADLFKQHLISVYLPWWIFGFLFLKFPFKRILLSLHFTLFGVYLLMTLVKGSFFARYVHLRGADVFFSIEPWLFTSLFLSNLAKKIELRGPLLTYIGRAACLGAFALVVAKYDGIRKEEFRPYENHFHDASFAQLSDWSLAHTNSRQVALTLDFDLIMNLPAYSPLNIYLPWAHSSPVYEEERFERLFGVFKFYGLSGEDVLSIFRSMKSHWDINKSADEDFQQGALMQLAVFYGPYTFEPIPEIEIQAIKGRYENFLRETKIFFKIDYLMVSGYDLKWIRPGSMAAKAVATSRPLFANDKYRVYSISL